MGEPLLLARLRSVHEHLATAGFVHALGGALALAVHAEPRFTADIDLNVIADADHPEAILAALPADLQPLPEAAETLRRDGQIRLMWSEPETPLDLFLPQHPTYHASVASRAELYAFPAFEIKVITATDLLVFKTLFGRSKNVVDIETMGSSVPATLTRPQGGSWSSWARGVRRRHGCANRGSADQPTRQVTDRHPRARPVVQNDPVTKAALTPNEARSRAAALAEAARSRKPDDWHAGLVTLTPLDGRGWLTLDDAARSRTWPQWAPVSGTRRWLGASLNERSGFVATITCLHVDGRFRERGVRALGHVMASRSLGTPGEHPTDVAAAVLTVRMLDHVPHVRQSAWEALRPHLAATTAITTTEIVLDVLLAGTNRHHASTALSEVQATLLEHTPVDELTTHLIHSTKLRVRRWAFRLGHTHNTFTTEHQVHAAQHDPDQLIRSLCAEWLIQNADPDVLAPLLRARSVEVRIAALTRVTDELLDDATLSGLLLDRAPRVRDQARWRAHHRGWDTVDFYRRSLRAGDASVSATVASLDGVAQAGDSNDVTAVSAFLQHPSGRVRSAAVTAVAACGTRDEALALLSPALLDPSGRVSSAVARVLIRLGAPASVAEPAWESEHPASRRAAWRLVRAGGGWDRVEADLRAFADADTGLARHGQNGITNWLNVGAATAWDVMGDEQRTRITKLLAQTSLDPAQERSLAFHTGTPLPERAAMPTEEAPTLPQGIARLTPTDPSDDVHGLLSVRRVTAWRTTSQQWLHTVRSDPYEAVAYEISWFDERTAVLFDDGVGDASDPFVSELTTGTVTLNGDRFTVTWLDGVEFTVANRALGEPF